MSVFVKKLNKHLEPGVLQPGEEIKEAFNLQKPGTSAAQVGTQAAGLVGGLIGATADKRQARKEEERSAGSDDTWAAPMPAWGVIVGLTDRRLMIWEASSGTGKPKELIVERELGQISDVETEDQKTKVLFGKPKSMDVKFRFDDGTMFAGAAITMGPAKKAVQNFLAELARLRP